MSKSLKNFITIKAALKEVSLRQKRLLFCLQPWNAPMTFNQTLCAGNCIPSTFKEQWCNYWLHAGHLSIDGLKMSKSLKNFITIKDALKEFSPRQLRLLFCLQPWNAPMTFSQASRCEMMAKEATFRNFFLNMQVPISFDSVSVRRFPSYHQKFILQTAPARCNSWPCAVANPSFDALHMLRLPVTHAYTFLAWASTCKSGKIASFTTPLVLQPATSTCTIACSVYRAVQVGWVEYVRHRKVCCCSLKCGRVGGEQVSLRSMLFTRSWLQRLNHARLPPMQPFWTILTRPWPLGSYSVRLPSVSCVHSCFMCPEPYISWESFSLV
jgi:hypothetical protein